jgi:lipopolysaccharide/colanic/teichoic acid biosynthesis glycosyltransferase
MLWIRLHDGGPVLFRQVRVGRQGTEFTCLKLRSMSIDAEDRLSELEARDHVLFKSSDDPRVTRPGRFIRRFSLDELPQLWNVVRGEMSLVGPRPPLPTEVEQYEDDMLRRLNVMPGMTGLWQVSGRSDLSWEDTVRLDLYYVDNWSMVQDLLILARTVTAVLASRGAY